MKIFRKKKKKNTEIFFPPLFVAPCLIHSTLLLTVSLTQADLLPRVGWQQEDQQGHGGQQHTRYEEVQGVEQGPPAQSHDEGHVGVGLSAALVKDFVTTTGDLWRTGGKPPQW